MEIDTGAFTALRDQVAALEAEVAALRRTADFAGRLGDGIWRDGYREGRESILGRQAEPRSPRPRHLQGLPGGAR